MDTRSASGPQLNSLRTNFNNLNAKRTFVGKSKRVLWASRRRFSNI